MKVYVIVILSLMKLAASVVDEELQAKYMTMTRSNFLEYFNEGNYSWTKKQYTNISLNMDIHDRNTEVIGQQVTLPVKYHNPHKVYNQLPPTFDARNKWPHCLTIKEIRDQLVCGSCWAHGVANTASDRVCIHSNAIIDLSVQDLECLHPQQSICHAASPSAGFKFWKDHGLVSKACKPYEPFDRNECVRFCKYNPALEVYLNSKVRAKEVYTVPNDSLQIKAELFINGPIQALMTVYEDFMDKFGQGYSSGIYEHTHGEAVNRHSVRVIGYGVENGVEYWLAANSWGPHWGEEGLFRIKSFQPFVGFEEEMTTGIPY